MFYAWLKGGVGYLERCFWVNCLAIGHDGGVGSRKRVD
jgi:hypothetical protein